MPLERLQKIIAAAGVASRRKAEQLISSGHVQVNGTVVTELGSKADPETDHVRVNGKLLHGAQRHVYLLLNKPKGFVTTMSDPEKRPTVMDLIRGVKGRVYPIGRLDYASEGLLLLTKTYVVKVAGMPKEEAIAKLRAGVSIATDDGRRVKTGPALVRVVKEAANPWYEITLVEGRNRQIRRMFEAVGHHVEKIKRVRYGPLTLDVPPGKFRSLTLREVEKLKSASKTNVTASKKPTP
jgi:23S rRNA pseudouridine2605 synthase